MEAMVDENIPATLPDTQNVDSQYTQSQDIENNEPEVWGRLCPHDDNLKTVALVKDTYTFGRLSECDISVKNVLDPKKEAVISKIHFKIYREHTVASNNIVDEVVFLKDESQNGTFVNDKVVGKGNKKVIENNDLIAVSKPKYKIFVYMSTKGYDNSLLPEELKDKYALSRSLGAGACGVVRLCFSKNERNAGKRFAMKIIKKNMLTANQQKITNDEKSIKNEIRICHSIQHPCVIRIEEFFDYPNAVYIVLELMEGGELFERIKKKNGIPEDKAKFIFYQVILAVNYLHENAITHRDLKPENILLASDEDETIVKVSDFGLSKYVDSQTALTTFCGTPMYVAPEILKTGGKGTYDSQVDVWSLGVILYCTLSGLTPFKIHDQKNSLADQITKGVYNFNSSKFFNVSSTAKDLIKKMMTVDPKKRITIKKILKHPWLDDDIMKLKVEKMLNLTNNENIRKADDNIIVESAKKRARTS